MDIFSPVSPEAAPDSPEHPTQNLTSVRPSARLSADASQALPALAPFVPSMLKSDLLRAQPLLPWVKDALRALSGEAPGGTSCLVSCPGC